MISLLIGGSHVFKFKLILTKAVAASEAVVSARPHLQQACKPRANCLKSKEIGKARRNGRRFDLRVVPNYLKVKTIGRQPLRGCWSKAGTIAS
jgi:hypothetical protein